VERDGELPQPVGTGAGTVLNQAVLIAVLLLAVACGAPAPEAGPPATLAAHAAAEEDSWGGVQASKAPTYQSNPENSIGFERLSREEGLSQGSILCILQDSLGFMWFCTEDGLNRYDGYEFTVYRHDPDDEDTLGQGDISSIHEDQEGMLWIRLYMGGLDRYDRKTGRFTHYDLFAPPDPDTASSDFVWTLYIDSGGTVWAGTYRSGLHRYDRKEDRFVPYRHDPNDVHSLSDDRVYAIYEDRQGALWVGTRGGLNRLDRETGRFTRYRHDPSDAGSLGSDLVQLILEDREGRFWVTTFGVGLEQFDRQTGRVVARYEHDPDNANSIDEANAITELYEDRLGFLWLVHFDGRLDKLDPEMGTFTRYRHDDGDTYSLGDDNVRFLAEDRAGNVWIGTAGGLDRYDREEELFLHYRHEPADRHSISGNSLSAFYEDQAGVLWIGTLTNGLNLYDARKTKFARYQIEAADADPDSNNIVNVLFEDSAGLVWAGTDAGLNWLDRKSGEWHHYQHDPLKSESLSQGWVVSIYEDRDGRLWIGTQSGLDMLDRATGRFTHYQQAGPDDADLAIGAVLSIVQDRSGVLWLGRHRYGLCRFDPETGECEQYAYSPENSLNPEDMVRQVYEDREGTLWLGTEGGLLRFDRESGTLTPYGHDPSNPRSLSHPGVRAIYEDSLGRFWVATDGGGLNLLDRATQTFTRHTDKDGLPSNVVLGILEDGQGNLWLSTGNGLSRFDPQAGTFRNYDTGDGLQDAEFLLGAYYQSRSGEMFFGGVNGLNAFYPWEIQDQPYVPPIALTSLTQGGVDLEPSIGAESLRAATLRWPNNYFEFEFAALSYSRPDRNQYAYRLEGFRDETWNRIGSKRSGRYTNLPGGTYTLRLIGSNSDGVWNEEGTSLRINVVPPFWETWWFRGLAVVTLALAGLGAYWQRTQSIRRRSRELEQQVTNRTRELAALNTIAAVVSRSLDSQKILDDALDKILEVTGLEAGGIYLMGTEAHAASDGILEIVAHEGLSAELVEGIDKLVVGEGFSGRVVQTGESLVVSDLSSDTRPMYSVVRASGFHFLAVTPVVSRAAVFGSLFVMARNETEFTEQDIELLSSIGAQIGVAIENARFFAAEQRRAEQFGLINQVGRELTLVLDVDQVLVQVTRMIQQAFNYYHVGIGLIEADEVIYRAGTGELWDDPDCQLKPEHLKVGEDGLCGWVAAKGEPLVVPDVSKDPRYVWLQGSRTRSELVVPIMVKRRVMGVLDVQSDRLNAFDDTDLAVLQSLGHQVGAAVENARLYEQAQEAAVMAERSRLARDLHDAVTQTLFSASLIAEAVPESWELDQREGRQLLSELQQLTRGALAEMRTLLLELRPAALVETAMTDLLHQLSEAATGRAGAPVTVIVSGDCVLPPDVHVALYRIAQEALNNVVKHARASQADVSLRCPAGPAEGGKDVELCIRDDGRGFDPEAVGPDHLGLGIMRERAEGIGARIEIESDVGVGTQVRVLWSEKRDAEGADES
jgi:ligand-binding sensor domain-containing protein/signal transduction histidine kinase